MPKLDWIGKNAVVRHHGEVPYRLLHCSGRLSAGDSDSGNLLVQGDNLEALRTLLPYYAGKVKCIYIDPPYNTGNEGWAYNDKVNSPQIKKWLDKVVGGEEDDLCRHDKWLCMMYPRLRLLRDFLSEDGVIFVSIDDNEQHHLRMLMDEIFGNKTEMIIWRKIDDGRYGKMKNTKTVRNDHEYIMAGFKSSAVFSKIKKLPYFASRPRADENGRKWWSGYIARGERGSNESHANYYTVTSPTGEKFSAQFEVDKKEFIRLDKIGYIHWSSSGTAYRKVYVDEPRLSVPSSVLLDVGTTYDGTMDCKNILGGKDFPNPKPVALIARLIELATTNHPDALILDSFAGSGTTAHAVLQQNNEDGGNRKFILVEMDKKISENMTAKRIQKAIEGYEYEDLNKKNKPKVTVPRLGGGFRFCTLGAPLFDEYGNVSVEVKFSDLAAHVFFSHTGMPIPKRATTWLLGKYQDDIIYLLYNGIMGDKSKNGGNVLTPKILSQILPPPPPEKTKMFAT